MTHQHGQEYVRRNRPQVESPAVKDARKVLEEGARQMTEYRRAVPIGEVAEEVMKDIRSRPTR